MTNILKQFEAWATALKQNKFQYATIKLTFFYVFSTALILLVSSLAVLLIFTPKDSYESGFFVDDHLEEEVEHSEFSLYEVRENLPVVIAVVDLGVLGAVSVLAYFFARRTLLPIKVMYESQQRFMSDVAHELRTPLAVMRAGSEATLRKKRTEKEYADFIGDIRTESERLTRLTNQFLTMLRIGKTADPDFKEEDISLLLNKVVVSFEAYATERRVSLKCDIRPGIKAETDKDSLIEVIQNILKNATDYNRPEGTVEVALTDLDKAVVIKISDSGIGIPPDKIKSVFERFVRVDSVRMENNTGGTGLGLAIVKDLVEKLNGSIELSSEVEVGTVVKVILPKVRS